MPNEEQGHDERLRELRDRLYSRGAPPPERHRRELADKVYETPTSWATDDLRTSEPLPVLTPLSTAVPMRIKKRSYRVKIIVAGLIFFIVALILSGSFLFFGKNMISGENIAIKAEGPLAVGGGEEFPITVTLANQNAVPIESATLIVEYPYGTQSPDEEGKELFRERRPIDRLDSGQALNIPLRARVFGEENEEKTVLVSIEYRVEGSNATFFKEAEPLRFKISSSPVIISVDNVSKSVSGQDVELKVTVSSNSPSPISETLVKAEYPAGFDFTDSKPGASSGRDTWSVSDLKPSEKRTIVVRGTLAGKQDEVKVFRFSVGVPNDRDRFTLASVFSTETEDISIEDPFLDIGVSINGEEGEQVVVTPGATAQVMISFKNTLSSTVYDGKISVDLSGTGLRENEVRVSDGFYDSSSNTITWSSNDIESLKSIAPGRVSTVVFEVTPDGSARTPQVDFTVNVEANRVSEDRVSQTLKGTVARSIKVQSAIELSSDVRYSIGAFKNTGPVPPRVESITTYGIRLHVKNGSNAAADGTVTLTLPAYVTWLGLTTSASAFAYNPQTREVSWKTGDLTADEGREAEFQISITPSASQINQVVTLAGTQRFKATDRFTGTVVRAEAAALTTELFADPEYEQEDGRIQPKDN